MDSFDDYPGGDPFGAAPPEPPPAPREPDPPPVPRAAQQPPLGVQAAPGLYYRGTPAAPTVARARAGLGVVAAAAGAAAGGVLLGPMGAGMGLMGVGALRNLYRAQHLGSDDPQLSSDAARGLALGVVGLGVVGYLAYRCFWASKDED